MFSSKNRWPQPWQKLMNSSALPLPTSASCKSAIWSDSIPPYGPRPLITKPMFFEVHRLSVFSPRSLDVDVVLDLMIHDIDVVFLS